MDVTKQNSKGTVMILAPIIIIGIAFTIIAFTLTQPIAAIVLRGFIGSWVAASIIFAIYIFVKTKKSQQ